MPKGTIGVAAMGPNANHVLATIQDLERRGVEAAWLTAAAGGVDNLTVFAAAAPQTERILLGSCIVTIWPRHPVIAATQVNAIAQLSDGRFRFGVGPGHLAGMSKTYGADYRTPLTALREYLTIVRSLFDTGSVEFQGKIFTANYAFPAPIRNTPLMASALRPKSYELCGELADGAISWVSPGVYLRDQALPAIQRGADKAKREAPPLVMHLPICVHEDGAEVLAACREQLANYPQSPFYQAMFAESGHPEAAETRTWSEGMRDSVVAWGTEDREQARIEELLDWGMGEIIAHIVTAGGDAAASRERSLALIEKLSTGRR
jgi:alkanesulfonate monooxygenase SsuD/methylene tetrahydromethanopterin reductase-like flavin-dependent oxidoreductase (luciferase family)